MVNANDDEGEVGILRVLDGLVREGAVRGVIEEVAKRVEAKLDQDLGAPLAWESVGLEVYGEKLPEFIRSSWVFALRGGSASGAERHPNSHQRVMSYRGVGDLQIRVGDDWRSNVLTDEAQAPLLARWASIPPHTWHQAVVTGGHGVVVSFHTALADELIEERPEAGDAGLTSQRRYLG